MDGEANQPQISQMGADQPLGRELTEKREFSASMALFLARVSLVLHHHGISPKSELLIAGFRPQHHAD